MKPNPNSFIQSMIQALGIVQPRPGTWLQGLTVAVLALVLSTVSSRAQTTVTANPADGATGVSGSAAVVFTFSAAMSTMSTSAFFQTPPSTFYPVTTAWNAGGTVLTCTPMSPFPANTTISWTVAGLDASMGFVTATGSFSTGTGGGGGGGGSGTNATTSFFVGKLYLNNQTNASAPVPFGGFGGAYDFTASTGLASNRVATAISLTLPNGTTKVNLNQNPVAHESYYFFDYSNSTPASFEAAYPQGNYVFDVTGPSNLQGTVSLPMTMAQPNAPHFTEFSLLQAIDSTKAFTVKWDPFTNGTSADAITLTISDDNGKTVFATPSPGTNGALSGTALSATVPAGKLAANSTNTAQLVFYRWVATSNANYVTFGYRASATELNMITISGVSASAPGVSNPVWDAKGFGFDVATTTGQALKVRFSTDCSLPISQWQTVLTTNSPGASVHINVPTQAGATGFFRLQNGP